MKRDELATQLIGCHQSFSDLIAGLTEEQFNRAPENKWNAGQQLDHLYRSVRPLVTAMKLPVWLPGLLFGKSNQPSTAYEGIVTRYRQQLSKGATATGQYRPQPIGYSARIWVNGAMVNAATSVAQQIRKLSEEQLDQFRLPHPLLGKLSFREMGYFTICHVRHHADSVKHMVGL